MIIDSKSATHILNLYIVSRYPVGKVLVLFNTLEAKEEDLEELTLDLKMVGVYLDGLALINDFLILADVDNENFNFSYLITKYHNKSPYMCLYENGVAVDENT